MSMKVGQSIRYMGPYDVCGGFGIHPYGGRIGTIVAMVNQVPVPEQPLSIQFSDGTVIKAAETEVRDPALPY